MLLERTSSRLLLARQSPGLPEGEVDALAAERGVEPILERHHPVKRQPGRTAPDHDVAVIERDPDARVRPLQATEQEPRGQAERDRDHRRVEILLVLVLMQRELGPRLIT